MKATVALFFVLSLVLSVLLPRLAVFLPFLLALAFGVYGLARSRSRRLDPLNDVPNAFRVFLASSGGIPHYPRPRSSSSPRSASCCLVVLGLPQRRVPEEGHRLGEEGPQGRLGRPPRHRRLGQVLALHGHERMAGREGIPGRADALPPVSVRREARLYLVRRPRWEQQQQQRPRTQQEEEPAPTCPLPGGQPAPPAIDLLGCRIEGRVVIYDRFIWSTYIKYKALGYPVRPSRLPLSLAAAVLSRSCWTSPWTSP